VERGVGLTDVAAAHLPAVPSHRDLRYSSPVVRVVLSRVEDAP
jgi:hypothetical protein